MGSYSLIPFHIHKEHPREALSDTIPSNAANYSVTPTQQAISPTYITPDAFETITSVHPNRGQICISPHHEDLVSSPANLNRQNAKSRLQQTSVKGPTEEQKTSVRLPKKQCRSILETTIRKGHPSNEHHNQHCHQLKYPASAVKYPVELPPWPEPDYFEYSFTNILVSLPLVKQVSLVWTPLFIRQCNLDLVLR
ncbi:hypothetical protein BDB01DRAFT_898939 [Pilobolus umbonatus]|nr:hypothetical protein BDB01DRAFT_898939 [Pilobolus umbonatus]